jgi:hypothetical protein
VFRDLFAKGKSLTGAPAARRVKTYSAQSGFSYDYWYEGHRPYRSRGETGTEFVFSISSGRAERIAASVFLSEAAVRVWEQAHARHLSATELYALAKMSLFQAFDERERPELMKAPVLIRAADIEAISETLEF